MFLFQRFRRYTEGFQPRAAIYRVRGVLRVKGEYNKESIGRKSYYERPHVKPKQNDATRIFFSLHTLCGTRTRIVDVYRRRSGGRNRGGGKLERNTFERRTRFAYSRPLPIVCTNDTITSVGRQCLLDYRVGLLSSLLLFVRITINIHEPGSRIRARSLLALPYFLLSRIRTQFTCGFASGGARSCARFNETFPQSAFNIYVQVETI